MVSSVIKEIARELNVSTASVSRALNDQPGVSDDLRARILQKASELNYTPSTTARGLATSQTFAAGFFVHQKPGLSAQSDPFYGEILHGAEQALAQSAYHLTIASLTDEILSSPGNFRFIREHRIDGMILAGPDIPSDFVLAMIRSGLPVVLVDNALDYSRTHAITSDDEGGAYLAADHLLTLGHRRVGVLSGPPAWPSNRRRVQGYHRALSEAGQRMRVVYADETTIESGAAAFQQIIEDVPQLTAICAVNDSMALGAIRAARAAGMRVPEEMSVIGFDNISWATLNDPPLTTLDIPKQQMGAEAARRLIMLLDTDGADIQPTHLTIAVQLIKRGTSTPPRAAE